MKTRSIQELKSAKKNLQLKSWFKAHTGTILSMQFNVLGTHIITCGKDRKVSLWNPHKQLCIKTYEGHGYEVRSVALTLDSSKFASAGVDKQFFLWDTFSGKIIRKFMGHNLPINSVCWGAEEQVLITGSDDKTLKIWDCRSKTQSPIQTINSFRDSVMSLGVPNWRKEIFAGSVDGTLRRFDIRAGEIATDEFSQAVTSIAIDNSGDIIIASCLDSTIRLIERSRGKILNKYNGHKNVGVKIDCCFTNTEDQIVGGSEDGTVYVWNRMNADIYQKLDTGIGPVISIATQSTHKHLATGGMDGIVKIWG
jgi:mitogen-activated protein kinase organizer 1